MILIICQKEIDLSVFGYPLSKIYCSQLDCTFPFLQYHVAMLVPWPETENRVFAPIKPFQLPVRFFYICFKYRYFFKKIDNRFGYPFW